MGGGFRALAVDTGIVAGLLSRASRRTGEKGKLKELFARTDMLSSVSGSTWFMSALVYSDSFASMVEVMGEDNGNNAGKIFDDQWTEKLLGINGGDSRLLQAVEKLLSAGGEPGDAVAGLMESLVLTEAWKKKGLTWQDFVEMFMSATTGITNARQLGDPTVSWSYGKVFLIDHSMITPSANAKTQKTIVWEERHGPGKISYSFTSPEALPRSLPATFSICLGQEGAQAPKGYIPVEALRSLGRLRYEALVAECWLFRCCPCPAVAEADASEIVGKFEENAGHLSVIGCAAASSDAPGAGAAYSKVPSCKLCDCCETLRSDLVSRAISSDASAAFSGADDLLERFSKAGRVTNKALEVCKQEAFRSLVDAGDTDATGIAFAVGAGAKNILAVLNFGTDVSLTGGSYDSPKNLTNLFAGADLKPHWQHLFPVFTSPTAKQVQDRYLDPSFFKELKGSKFLKGIRVGTICATTCQNKWFGIDGNQIVQLVIVSVGTAVTFGEGVDFRDYNELVQEIVDAIKSTQDGDVIDNMLFQV